MVTRSAFGAGETAGDARYQRILVDRELDHMIEAPPAFSEEQVERFGLRLGPGKTVEDGTAFRGGIQALAN